MMLLPATEVVSGHWAELALDMGWLKMMRAKRKSSEHQQSPAEASRTVPCAAAVDAAVWGWRAMGREGILME